MFYDNFDKLCTKIGTSPTAFTRDVLGLSTSKVTAWKGGSIPKYEILQKIADVFDVSVGELFDGENLEDITNNVPSKAEDVVNDVIENSVTESKFRDMLNDMSTEDVAEILNYARYLRWRKNQVL